MTLLQMEVLKVKKRPFRSIRGKVRKNSPGNVALQANVNNDIRVAALKSVTKRRAAYEELVHR